MLKLLDLSYRAKCNEFPYLIVNCVFKVEEDENLKLFALADAQDCGPDFAFKTLQDLEAGKGERVYTLRQPVWNHIPKFDVFWFREYVSDCSVTRACLYELRVYEEQQSFPYKYRQIDGGVVMRHLRTLQSYWD